MKSTKSNRAMVARGLSVRVASSTNDIECTAQISQKAHEESWFKNYPYSEEKRRAFVLEALASPSTSTLLIAEIGDNVLGVLYCRCDEYIIGSHLKMANVYGFYVDKRSRNSLTGGKAALLLMKYCLEWSRNRNCVEILFHATAKIETEKTTKFFRRLNMTYLGGNYSIKI
jgi:hypothetical protein